MLSGGERTRLAVARMLLRPANTLLLDEPTNHLDLDSKDVLLEALEDFGGTLIFVSHDRYFVDRLATKVIEVGHGQIEVYPGTYEEFLWSKQQRASATPATQPSARPKTPAIQSPSSGPLDSCSRPGCPAHPPRLPTRTRNGRTPRLASASAPPRTAPDGSPTSKAGSPTVNRGSRP